MRDAADAFAACAAVVLGILISRTLPPGPGIGLAAVAALSIAGAITVRLPPARVAFVLLALACLGGAVDLRARHGLVEVPFDQLVHGGPVNVVGRVVADPEPHPWSTRVTLAVDSVRRPGEAPAAGGGRHVLAAGGRPSAGALSVLEVGDRVVIQGRLTPLREADRWRRRRHVVAAVRVEGLLDFSPGRNPVVQAGNVLRHRVLAGSATLAAQDRSLLAGFLVGDTRHLTPELRQQFQASGLGHLLAVSGANVSFVLALLAPALRRLRLGGRVAASAGAVLVFAAATRFEPSVVRAAGMTGVALLAALLGRPASGLRALAVAVTVLVLLDPFLVDSLGFRLSCGATLGMLLVSPSVRARLRFPALVAEPIATTVGAQIGVLPFLVGGPGAPGLATVPANLLAGPAAAPLTLWGLPAGVLGGAVAGPFPDLAALVQAPAVLSSRWIRVVARVATEVHVSIPHAPGAVLVLLAGVVAALVVGRAGRSRRLGTDAVHPPPRRPRP